VALNYDRLMALKRTGDRFSYTDRETMLYAIGIGMSRDPYDENELAYTFERAKLKTVASMATVLQRVPLLKDCGFDYSKVVHGEQRLTLHRPLEPEDEIVVDSRVLSAFDKGPGKGAVINSEMAVRSAKDNTPLYTLISTTFARGDGGFGGPNGAGLEPHRIPERKPDLTAAAETRIDQALLYRLNGDRNPLHAQPEFAKMAGFPEPILHGLCSYGIAARAVLELLCGNDPRRLKRFDLRFASPVFPGETIRTEVWLEAPGRAAFRARVVERDQLILNSGLAEFTPAA